MVGILGATLVDDDIVLRITVPINYIVVAAIAVDFVVLDNEVIDLRVLVVEVIAGAVAESLTLTGHPSRPKIFKYCPCVSRYISPLMKSSNKNELVFLSLID